MACSSPDEKVGFKWQIAIVPFDGDVAGKFIDLPTSANNYAIWWSPDGHSIDYIDGTGASQNIYAQPIDGGPRKQLTNFKSDYISTFNWTRDGKQLILGRGPLTDDVVLIKDFH